MKSPNSVIGPTAKEGSTNVWVDKFSLYPSDSLLQGLGASARVSIGDCQNKFVYVRLGYLGHVS
jgi:hypothetical protein